MCLLKLTKRITTLHRACPGQALRLKLLLGSPCRGAYMAAGAPRSTAQLPSVPLDAEQRWGTGVARPQCALWVWWVEPAATQRVFFGWLQSSGNQPRPTSAARLIQRVDRRGRLTGQRHQEAPCRLPPSPRTEFLQGQYSLNRYLLSTDPVPKRTQPSYLLVGNSAKACEI